MIDRASGLPESKERGRSSELERVMGKVKRRNVKIIISRSSRDVASFSDLCRLSSRRKCVSQVIDARVKRLIRNVESCVIELILYTSMIKYFINHFVNHFNTKKLIER